MSGLEVVLRSSSSSSSTVLSEVKEGDMSEAPAIGGKKRSLTIITPSDISGYTAIRKTMADWKSLVHDRFGSTRALFKDAPCEANKEKLEEDQFAMKQYVSVLNDSRDLMGRAVFPVTDTGRIVAALDEESNVQAMAIYGMDGGGLCIKYIMTAPWNLKLHGENPAENKPLETKGSGTFLIAHLYTVAQTLGARELRLKPLMNSTTFYKNHLSMTPDAEHGEFFYPVTEEVPEKLRSLMLRYFG